MTTSDPSRPAKARRSRSSDGGPQGEVSTAAMARAARQMPRTVLREFSDHPAAVLVAIAGTSFVAGAILGSRLGRALLVALMPVGLSYAVKTGAGDELRDWVTGALSRAEAEEEE